MTQTTTRPPDQIPGVDVVGPPVDHLSDPLFSGSKPALDVDEAGDVLSQSNAHPTEAWRVMNGGSTELNATGTKPRAWRRGFEIDGDQVSVNDGTQVSSVQTLDDYKKMVRDDFNFQKATEFFDDNGGQEAFLTALADKYPDHPLGAEALEQVGIQLWSYAQTGADTQGNTDIGQLQGLLRPLDTEIATSSDTNTPMSETEFTLPGTEISLPEGDDTHGRATILTTRHLMGSLVPDDAHYTTTLLVLDLSASMEPETKRFAELLDRPSMKNHSVMLATFWDRDSGVPLRLSDTLPDGVSDTYANLMTQVDLVETERKAAAAKFSAANQARTDARDNKGDVAGAQKAYEIARDAFYALDAKHKALDEYAQQMFADNQVLEKLSRDDASDLLKHQDKDKTLFFDADDPMEESGFEAALAAMARAPEALPGERRQLLIMTDEGEARADLLDLVRKTAKEKKFDVRVLISHQVHQDHGAHEFSVIPLEEVPKQWMNRRPTGYESKEMDPAHRSKAAKDRDVEHGLDPNRTSDRALHWREVGKKLDKPTVNWDDL